MGKMEKPPEIMKKQLEGDMEALKAMGRVGGKHAAINREVAKAMQLEDIALEQEPIYHVVEGDVMPPDKDTLETLKDN